MTSPQRSGSLVVLILSCVALGAAAGDDQRPRPKRGAPDEAVPFDPIYFELSAATGGNFYFWVPGEFSRTTALPLMGAEDLLVANGEMSLARELAIPVDAGLARLDLFAGVQARAELELRDPGAELVSDGRAGVTLQRTRLMLLAQIRDPTPGTWTLRLSGSGLFCVTARGTVDREREPVEFLGFSFVELRGRPGHEGYFDRREPPPPGETSLCKISIEGAQGESVVDFLSGDGSPLGIAAEALDSADEDDESLWRCPVPTQPYRVRVSGRDASGRAFQRVEAALRNPKQEALPSR